MIAIQSIAARSFPIAGSARQPVERCGAFRAAAFIPAFYRDLLPGFVNLTGYLSRWSFLPRVQASKQARGILRILFGPNVLSLVAVHAVNLAKDPKHEEPKSRES